MAWSNQEAADLLLNDQMPETTLGLSGGDWDKIGGFAGSALAAQRTEKKQNAGFNTMSPTGSSVLDELIKKLFGQQTEFTRQNALADTQAAIQNTFKQFQGTLPAMFAGTQGLGAYNSTATNLMANDAYSKAVGQAAALQHQAIKDYAMLQNQEIMNLIQALNVNKGSKQQVGGGAAAGGSSGGAGGALAGIGSIVGGAFGMPGIGGAVGGLLGKLF